MVFAAMFPLGAAGQVAGRVVVPVALVAAAVLEVVAHSLQLANVVLAATL